MDNANLSSAIVDWLRDKVKSAGARGLVVGLSGGIDSAVIAALCQRAFPEEVLGVLMPCHSDPRDESDARLLAEALKLSTTTVDLTGIFDLFASRLNESFTKLPPGKAGGSLSRPDATASTGKDLATANIKPRLRMIALYHHAAKLNYLVAGTGNRSELTAGYFTKYGDGGVDLLPIGGLVKSQVRELARYLRIPEPIIEKAPSAGLWQGQTDEGEMGMTYTELDRYILTGEGAPEVRDTVARLNRQSEHKRRLPEIFQPPAQS
ncbi:MAG: NAD(+) synthase [Firmicutes bacterium]|nr:NAD(+) synthase [Bacillota bacterium]